MNKWIEISSPDASDVLLQWWRHLEETPGKRAELRRCSNPEEVYFCRGYHELYKALHSMGDVRIDRLAVVAGVLSHVRSHRPDARFAAMMAAKKGDGTRVSEMRFEKLLRIDDANDLYMVMIRMVRLLDGTANIPDLAAGVYWWNDRTKKDWAFAYYGEIV